jgi:hypothetical protein
MGTPPRRGFARGGFLKLLRGKFMEKDDLELEDEPLPEYDLKSLRVRKLGSGQKGLGSEVVRLEPDVAEMFPTADAVY